MLRSEMLLKSYKAQLCRKYTFPEVIRAAAENPLSLGCWSQAAITGQNQNKQGIVMKPRALSARTGKSQEVWMKSAQRLKS